MARNNDNSAPESGSPSLSANQRQQDRANRKVKRFSVSVTKDQELRLTRIAEKENRPVSFVIGRAVREFLDRVELEETPLFRSL